MTDKILDSDQIGADGEKPISQVTPTGDKPTSSPAAQSQGDIEERLKRIEKMVSSFQSEKDRGINAVSKDNAELRKSFGELQTLIKKGLSEEDAFEELGRRKSNEEFQSAVLELRDFIKGGKTLPAQASEAIDVASVVTQYGLQVDDPVVVAKLQGKSFKTETEAKAAILDVIKEKSSLPNPNRAQMPTPPGNPTGAPGTDELTKQYMKDMQAAMGNPQLARQIREEAVKKGVPVDTVVFH